MNYDLIKLLEAHRNDEGLGPIINEAIEFARDASVKWWRSPGTGQPSFSVAKTYRTRIGNKKYKKEAFSGMEESILSLAAKDVTVHLSVIETDKGVVSVWLENEHGPPVGIVIGRFLPTLQK
jgi:hypothetical protein